MVEDLKRYKSISKRSEIIEELESSDALIIIYGTGRFARSVAEVLFDRCNFVFCDMPSYYKKNKFVDVQGKLFPVWSEEQLSDYTGKYGILLGVVDYSLIEYLKERYEDAVFVEYLDVHPTHIMDWDFVENNKDVLNEIYCSLADDESRNVMKGLLISRLTGDVSYINQFYTEKYSYDYKLLGITTDDIIVDGGAYTGDTILELQSYLGGQVNKIYAFEPDSNNFIALKNQFANDENVECICAGLYSRNSILKFSNDGIQGSKITFDGSKEINCISLDEHEQYSNVTVIKLDIEGSELEALKGCKRLLKENHPNLAVCIYHKNEDIIEICRFLMEISREWKGYDLYLRQHSHSVEETVLYAVTNRRNKTISPS